MSNKTTTATTVLRLSGFCLGLPGWAGTRKVKPNQSGFPAAKDSEWQWYQLGHMQICTSLQTDNYTRTPPLSFYRLNALPATQPTASKHWRLCAIKMKTNHKRNPTINKVDSNHVQPMPTVDISYKPVSRLQLRFCQATVPSQPRSMTGFWPVPNYTT